MRASEVRYSPSAWVAKVCGPDARDAFSEVGEDKGRTSPRGGGVHLGDVERVWRAPAGGRGAGAAGA